MFAYMHRVIAIAVVQHTLCDGSRSVFLIGKDAYLPYPFYQRAIELRPRAACQRDDTHVVIWNHQTVCQHLQGVKGGIDCNSCIRKFTV